MAADPHLALLGNGCFEQNRDGGDGCVWDNTYRLEQFYTWRVLWIDDKPYAGLDDNGQPHLVQMDESVFFKTKYNVGQRRELHWVIGGIQRGDHTHVLRRQNQ